MSSNTSLDSDGGHLSIEEKWARSFTRSYPYTTVYEGQEPEDLWTYLIQKDISPVSRDQDLPVALAQPIPRSYKSKTVRLFRCACTEGYFVVQQVPNYLQTDLKPDTCVIVDPGVPFSCFVWVGHDSGDVVKKFTRKSVQVYLEHLNDGRTWAMINDREQVPETSESNHELQKSDDLKLHSTLSFSLPSLANIDRNRNVVDSMKTRHELPLTSNTSVSPFSIMKSSFKEHDAIQMPLKEGDVYWVFQGAEPVCFRSLFHAWNDVLTAVMKDPRQMYLSSVKLS